MQSQTFPEVEGAGRQGKTQDLTELAVRQRLWKVLFLYLLFVSFPLCSIMLNFSREVCTSKQAQGPSTVSTEAIRPSSFVLPHKQTRALIVTRHLHQRPASFLDPAEPDGNRQLAEKPEQSLQGTMRNLPKPLKFLTFDGQRPWLPTSKLVWMIL